MADASIGDAPDWVVSHLRSDMPKYGAELYLYVHVHNKRSARYTDVQNPVDWVGWVFECTVPDWFYCRFQDDTNPNGISYEAVLFSQTNIQLPISSVESDEARKAIVCHWYWG